MKDKPFMCGACHKRFATEIGARDHARHHKRAKVSIYQRIGDPVQTADDEPSMAETVIAIQLKQSMGTPLEEWEASLVEGM